MTTETTAAREPSIGDMLTARYGGQVYSCEVVAGEKDGDLGYSYNFTTYRSLSGAGKAVTGRISCNGRTFWTIQDGEERIAIAATAPRPRSVPNGNGKQSEAEAEVPVSRGFPLDTETKAPRGEKVLFCARCKKGFSVDAEENPERCPSGHLAPRNILNVS